MTAGAAGTVAHVTDVLTALREIFGFLKFTLGLEPKFHIFSDRSAIFLPDLPCSLSDFVFVCVLPKNGLAVSGPPSEP